MRLENDIIHDGYFWIPGKEDKKVLGTLNIKEEESIYVDLKDLFEVDDMNNINFELIHGHIDKLGYVSLTNCFYTKQQIHLGGISHGNATLLVNLLYSGALISNPDELLLDSINFSCDYLDEWIGISGINVERQNMKPGEENAIYYKKQIQF